MSLGKKTKTALDEGRTLMLGAQILLGLQIQAPFQNAFDRLPEASRRLELIVLSLMVVVIGLLIAPSAHHRIVEHGEASGRLNRLITTITAASLLPFSVALALDLGIVGERIAGLPAGLALGIAGFGCAIGFWYGPVFHTRERRNEEMDAEQQPTSLSKKIEYVLTEARVVLPGAQALLGFQLSIVLTDGFASLPEAAKLMHGGALGAIALATILLMAPASYHRLVYHGADAPRVQIVASRFLVAATVFLAIGLSADIWVVAGKISGNAHLASLIALSSAAVLLALWHIWPWVWRRTRETHV